MLEQRCTFGRGVDQTVFRCSSSEARDTPKLERPPLPLSDQNCPGDIHFHTHRTGVQYWTVSAEPKAWISASIGSHHPVLGAARVLSHGSGVTGAQGLKGQDRFPGWVKPETLLKYQRRKLVVHAG